MVRLLWAISDHARLCLILGLAAGLGLPSLAQALAPWLPQMVAVLLAVTALRLGHEAVMGAVRDVPATLGAVVGLQLVLPLAILAVAMASGQAHTPWVLAAVIATAAPAISGSANLALILRQDAGAMMRVMVLGTALFPLTVLPVLALMPQLGDPGTVLLAAAKLLGVIFAATAFGFLLRIRFFPAPDAGQIKALDGLSVFAFSAIVVGLMAALTPRLQDAPGEVALWALLAFGLSYGLQGLVYATLGRHRLGGPLALAAGNRNIALFLVALPAEVMAPIMVFVGCWQVPMYLTPVLLRWLYARKALHE